jgi:hypothetical protein
MLRNEAALRLVGQPAGVKVVCNQALDSRTQKNAGETKCSVAAHFCKLVLPKSNAVCDNHSRIWVRTSQHRINPRRGEAFHAELKSPLRGESLPRAVMDMGAPLILPNYRLLGAPDPADHRVAERTRGTKKERRTERESLANHSGG